MQKKNKVKVIIEEIIPYDHDKSETFNKSFANIVPNVKIISNKNFETAIEREMENSVQNAISKFKNHPRIKMIIYEINPNKRFSFCQVSYDEI